ncbi:Prolipoprotein diacylglyceryl transferase [Aquisphaera giovannonii]|uniref:Phosphatidylglycerol--prolipoprotein diacylglyceryl transferase n=1 Tax=Aquisphaera giovannonii TaxID=406548 RepID=A0A5B9WDL7_9BACT|nr:prolipoprotein diacylglyceryl transferase [Aquisphaera giovannonii]QEH37990.1 Prolipoprotein diacylglyceryl transferase [Aquisphaera giovannonii]
MRQVLFTIPFLGWPVFGYGAMLVLAFVSSTWLAAWRARKEKLNPDVILDMAFWVFFIGLVAARLFYCVQYWGTEIQSLAEVVKYWKGGIVYYGGIIGGVLAFFGYWKLHPFPMRPYLDALSPSIMVGTLFGRLGCFLNGCCFGDVCNLPWAVSFPKPSPPWSYERALKLIPEDAAWSLPLHPTQLYSAFDGLVIFALLTAYYPVRRRDGEVLGLLMLAYPVTRFLIEYLRSDEGDFFAGFTISQNISILLFLGGLAYWAWLRRYPPGRYADEAAGEGLEKPAVATAAAR